MGKIIRDLFTGPDCVTWDLVRVSTGVSLVSGLGLQVASVWKSGTFDFQQFGLGLGAIIAAGAGGMWARRDREVDPQGQQQAGDAPEKKA